MPLPLRPRFPTAVTLFLVACSIFIWAAEFSAPGALAQATTAISPFEHPLPPYPEAAQASRVTGVVTLRVTYPVDGLPLKVEVSKSSGSALLDNAAADFARLHWRSHGLSAVTTKETEVEFQLPPNPMAPVSFNNFPEGATPEERKNGLFWRAVPTITSLLIDLKADGAMARTREAMQVSLKLDPRDFSSPISLLQAVISNFDTAPGNNEVGIVIARNDGGEPNVLTISVPPQRVPIMVRLVQKTVAAGIADLRASAATLSPPQTPAEKATLAAGLTKLETNTAALVAKAPLPPPAATASPSAAATPR